MNNINHIPVKHIPVKHIPVKHIPENIEIRNNRIINNYLDQMETVNKIKMPIALIYLNTFLLISILVFMCILSYDFYALKPQIDNSFSDVNELIKKGTVFLNEGTRMIPEVKDTIYNISRTLKDFNKIKEMLLNPMFP